MGEDLSSGAKIGIILIILCFLIAIVLALLMVVKNITNSGATKMESGLDQMDKSTFDDYDQQVVTGTKAIAAVKLFEGQPIGVVIIPSQAATSTSRPGGFCYGQLISGYTDPAKVTDSTDPLNGQQVSYGQVAPEEGGSTATSDHLVAIGADSFYTASPKSGVYNYNIQPVTISGSDAFVRTNGRFLAKLIKDSSGTTIGVCFQQIVG